ncbi:MAG: ribosomal RNA small subunit methyltransferase A [Sphaerochaetaceae bacterium]|nr:ribosomal RNA small subunit methyltransferase A [Sphaerochaetaceae bacterium]
MIWDFDYTSISSISKLLEENGLSMSKKFGQNFLISQGALDKIAALGSIKEGTKVWEVGPGIGALTNTMLRKGAFVTAFEIDHGFCRILREKAFGDCPSFRLIEGDALKNWKKIFEEEGTPDLICANLPYNVGSIFIANLIEERCLPEKMVFTLQTEVVKRICAKQKDPEFSGYSILTSIDYDNKEALKLKAPNFYPQPNVDSSVVVMTKKNIPDVPNEEARAFIAFTRVLFSQKRKTIKNNLKALGKKNEDLDKALTNVNISINERAENLSTAQILSLKRQLEL